MSKGLADRCEEYAETILRRIMKRHNFGGVVLQDLAAELEQIVLKERRKGD